MQPSPTTNAAAKYLANLQAHYTHGLEQAEARFRDTGAPAHRKAGLAGIVARVECLKAAKLLAVDESGNRRCPMCSAVLPTGPVHRSAQPAAEHLFLDHLAETLA
jgi:hypothetical protein